MALFDIACRWNDNAYIRINERGFLQPRYMDMEMARRIRVTSARIIMDTPSQRVDKVPVIVVETAD